MKRHDDIFELKNKTKLNTIETNVGDLTTLTTTDKTSIVKSINENKTQINNLAAEYDKVIKLTAAEYAALATKDANTLYLIVEV